MIIQKDIGSKQNHLVGDGLLWRGRAGLLSWYTSHLSRSLYLSAKNLYQEIQIQEAISSPTHDLSLSWRLFWLS